MTAVADHPFLVHEASARGNLDAQARFRVGLLVACGD
jgi:hypothetical protein